MMNVPDAREIFPNLKDQPPAIAGLSRQFLVTSAMISRTSSQVMFFQAACMLVLLLRVLRGVYELLKDTDQ